MKMFAWELRGKGLGRGRGKEGRKEGAGTFDKWPLLAKDVQVDWCGLAQSMKDLVDLLDVEPLLRFSLPAAQHDVVNFLGADSRPFQNSALGNALNDLKERKETLNTSRAVPGGCPVPAASWVMWYRLVNGSAEKPRGLQILGAHLFVCC